MKNALRMAGMSLAMGLMMVGCGGPVESEQESASVETREDALPECSHGGTLVEYYSDATYNSLVGARGCECGAYVRWGKTSSFTQYVDTSCHQ